jgi:hypothetical protein
LILFSAALNYVYEVNGLDIVIYNLSASRSIACRISCKAFQLFDSGFKLAIAAFTALIELYTTSNDTGTLISCAIISSPLSQHNKKRATFQRKWLIY